MKDGHSRTVLEADFLVSMPKINTHHGVLEVLLWLMSPKPGF
jgi:uncharacterized protein (DUF362 family)